MMEISAHHGGECVTGIDPREMQRWIDSDDVVLWIDITDPSDEDFSMLERAFDFHPLAIEDVRDNHKRPKVDFYTGYAFIVVHAVHLNDARRRMATNEVELFVGSNYIVTLHDLPIAALSAMRERWEANTISTENGITPLFYAILDIVIDSFFPALDWIADRIEEIEHGIFEQFDQRLLEDAMRLKRALLALRRVAGPQRDVINVLLRGESNVLPDEAHPYLQDLFDHSLRVVESVDTFREMILGVSEAFLSVQSNRTNDIMKRLTLINLLFLPLAVLTGFFGMNFEILPFQSTAVFAVALLLMVALPTSFWLLLRRDGLE